MEFRFGLAMSNGLLQLPRARMFLRPFLLPNEPRARAIGAQVMALPESEVQALWAQVRAEFGDRHATTIEFLQRRLAVAVPGPDPQEDRRLDLRHPPASVHGHRQARASEARIKGLLVETNQ